jgi:hypothetical protein
MNIRDKELIKKVDSKPIKKVYLLYIDGDKKICDCCDEDKELASIVPLCGDVMCICKECLQLIINEF